MIVVPGLTPYIMPELVPIVATAVALLLQVPPVTASLNVTVRPWQTTGVPIIVPGVGTTVTFIVSVCRHPPASVTVTI
jgi:hypothetical protein